MKRFALILFSFLLINFTAANENGIAVENLLLQQNGAVFYLNADLNIQWNEPLTKNLEHGIPIFFVSDAQIYKPRWWWADKKIAAVQKKWAVSYHPMTREYRLESDTVQFFRDFESLAAALSRIRGWEIVAAEKLENGEKYTLLFRFALDYEALPKTFQIGIWGNREWALDSGWIFQKNLALTVENFEKAGEK